MAGTERGDPDGRGGRQRDPRSGDLDALDIAHEAIKKLCAAQDELRELAGKEKVAIDVPQVHPELYEEIRASHGAALDAATQVEDKLDRQDATKRVEEEILVQYSGDPEADSFADYRATPSGRSTSSRRR